MQTLYTKNHEREGNDCWIKTEIFIIRCFDDYLLNVIDKVSGWCEGIYPQTINLGDNIENAQTNLNIWISGNGDTYGIEKIDLGEQNV